MTQDEIFIIGDVHGCYNTLMSLIAKLPDNAKLCFVGDLIDRGPNSSKVIDFIRENNHDCVLGNHEEMMITAANDKKMYNKPLPLSDWFYNGGELAYKSFKNDEEFYNIVEWAESLPLAMVYKDLKDAKGRQLLVTHSCGLNSIIDYLKYIESLDEDNPEWQYQFNNSKLHILWSRTAPKSNNTQFFNIFGHSPTDYFIGKTPYSKKDILWHDDIIFDDEIGYADIDTGACYMGYEQRGVLTAIGFPSMTVYKQHNVENKEFYNV